MAGMLASFASWLLISFFDRRVTFLLVSDPGGDIINDLAISSYPGLPGRGSVWQYPFLSMSLALALSGRGWLQNRAVYLVIPFSSSAICCCSNLVFSSSVL